MDRSSRTPIFEPLLLILKQRTGIATVISMVVSGLMYTQGASVEEIIAVLSPIFIFVAKQGYVDSKESSAKTVEQFEGFRSEVLDLVSVLMEGFEPEEEVSKDYTIKGYEASEG